MKIRTILLFNTFVTLSKIMPKELNKCYKNKSIQMARMMTTMNIKIRKMTINNRIKKMMKILRRKKIKRRAKNPHQEARPNQ